MAMQWTGLGSMMCVHFAAGPIANPADAAGGDPALRELFFFDMLARGFYLARRGMAALSLEVGSGECDGFCYAVEDFIATRGTLIPRS